MSEYWYGPPGSFGPAITSLGLERFIHERWRPHPQRPFAVEKGIPTLVAPALVHEMAFDGPADEVILSNMDHESVTPSICDEHVHVGPCRCQASAFRNRGYNRGYFSTGASRMSFDVN